MASSKSYLPLIGTVVIVITFYYLQTHPIASLFHHHVVAGMDHTYTKHAIEVNEWLEGAFFPLRNVPISVLDLCGSILVCLRYREGLDGTKSWFESLVACTLLQFGGTTLTGLILGQTPSWIVSHSAFPALLLAWYLTFYCPSDVYFTLMGSKESNALLFIIGIFAAISGGHAVTSWGLDKAAFNTFHVNHVRISQSVLTCLLCGTLSGCGGGLLSDWLNMTTKSGQEPRPFTLSKTPNMFVPSEYKYTATLNRCCLLATLYYMMLNQHKYMPWEYSCTKEVGHLVISTLQVGHFLLMETVQVDVFQMFSTMMLQDVLMITPCVANTGAIRATAPIRTGTSTRSKKSDDDATTDNTIKRGRSKKNE